jgi:hypothetical protein
LPGKDNLSHYDFPKFPARPVSPEFFRKRKEKQVKPPKLEIVSITVEPRDRFYKIQNRPKAFWNKFSSSNFRQLYMHVTKKLQI